MHRSFFFLTLAMLAVVVSACAAASPQTTQPLTPIRAVPSATSKSSTVSSPTSGAVPTVTPIATWQPTQTEPAPSPETGPISVRLAEVSVVVTYPSNYTLTKSQEENRRGSFVSYDFTPPHDYQTPYLAEIQFFSAESIQEFTKDCLGTSPCFFGDYPDLDRYQGQQTAYAALTNYQHFELRRIGERYYFVSNHPCEGDVCVIREYTTFISGDIKVDIWIMMADESQTAQSDELFLQFHLQK